MRASSVDGRQRHTTGSVAAAAAAGENLKIGNRIDKYAVIYQENRQDNALVAVQDVSRSLERMNHVVGTHSLAPRVIHVGNSKAGGFFDETPNLLLHVVVNTAPKALDTPASRQPSGRRLCGKGSDVYHASDTALRLTTRGGRLLLSRHRSGGGGGGGGGGSQRRVRVRGADGACVTLPFDDEVSTPVSTAQLFYSSMNTRSHAHAHTEQHGHPQQ